MADLTRKVVLELLAKNRAAGELVAFQKQTTNLTKGIQSMARTFLTFAGVGGGVYLLQRSFRAMINSASDAQETLSKFNVVFRDQAKEAARWAEDFGDSVGRSTQDVQKWMASLQDTFVPLGFARDKAMELSKSLSQLAVDVASFNNKADADVIRDFTSALVGNHETVRKYGIIISESAIKQEALNQGLDKTYKELTDLEKVQLRYNLIQSGTTDAQGDALRTADSYANQVKRLKANITELRTELGGPLIQNMSSILQEINKHSDAWAKFFKTQAEGWAEVFSGFEGLRTILDELHKRSAEFGPFGGFGTMGVMPPRPSFRGHGATGTWESEEEFLNKRLREVYGQNVGESGKSAEQLQSDMNYRVKIHEYGMRRITDLEEESQRLMRYHYEETKLNFVTMWDPVIDGSMNATEAMKSFFKNLLIQVVQARAQLAMLNLWHTGVVPLFTTGHQQYMKQPYPVHHQGGIVGNIPPTRLVDPAVFHNAPKYHDLLPGEVAIIAKEGERISGPGGGKMAPTIIFNNSGPPLRQKGEAQYDGEKIIINIESALNERIQRRSGPLFETIRGLK